MDLENTKRCTVTSKGMFKDNVLVGKDWYKNVEYHIFNHEWWVAKETKTFKDSLENIWYFITTPYYRIKK